MIVAEPLRMKEAPMEILLIEDSMTDQALTAKALQVSPIPIQLYRARTGGAGLAMLDTAETLPDLILLDLMLPDGSGLDILAKLKAHPTAAAVPIVVITASEDGAEIREAYRLHANAVIRKPTMLSSYQEALQSAISFFGHARRPWRRDSMGSGTKL